MAHFVCVPGAWHGGWVYDSITPSLHGKGHSITAIDLPGAGGTPAELAAVTLADWGAHVAAACQAARQQGNGPVILLGHSRGGLVISAAAEQAPEAMDALIYLCAMLLPSGMSRAAFKAYQMPNPAFDAIIRPLPGGVGTTIDPAGAPAVFAQLAPARTAAAAAQRLIAEPASPRTTALTLTQQRYGTVPRYYIECTQDRTIPIEDQRRMQRLQPCQRVISLHADHSPFLSAPEALAQALLSIENAVREGTS